MSRHRRPSLGDAYGYIPGEQPADAARWIKLNTNESPLPPSPRVAAAIAAAAADLRRYPSPTGEPLRSALAQHHHVEVSQVCVGNGADALLEACFRAFCEPGDTVVGTSPTYSLLAPLAVLHAAQLRQLELDSDGVPPAEFASAEGPMRVLVNPNAPTGTWLPPEQVEVLLQNSPGLVVIDEAYGDFAPASCLPLLARHPSWLVIRTFSKSYALAGLRVGYAVGATDVIADLQAVGESYALDRCAIAGAAAALADHAHHRAIVALVRDQRRRIAEALTGAGWTVSASQANFVCATPPTGGGALVAARLREHRILVRHFPVPGAGFLRITVGTAAENDALLAALG